MTNKEYTTEEKIENLLDISITTGEADDAILAAQKMIDETTGRSFKADTSALARLYSGDGINELVIDDCVEVTKVEVGANHWGDSFTEIDAGTIGTSQSDVYYTEPQNRMVFGGDSSVDEVIPIRKIVLRSRVFTYGRNNHRITAKWGYSHTPPEDIVIAATILAGMIYQYGRSGVVGGTESERIGNYQVKYATSKEAADLGRVKSILERYKKYSI